MSLYRTIATIGAAVVGAAAPFALQSRAAAQTAADGSDQQQLAKQLSNPVSSLISVPIKLDWDDGIGPKNASRTSLTVQPVIPVAINPDWNVIVRTIVPFVVAESPAPGVPSATGLADTTQSFFFSPASPTASGWVWGAGPVFLYPTASRSSLGSGKWGAGPTFVVLRQSSGWTYGLLANQIWSFAGSSGRPDVNTLFLQPFLSFTTPRATTFGLSAESSYDWRGRQWTVPINATVGQLVKLGRQPVSFTFGARYYAEAPSGGPDWGLRFQAALLFPKK